MNDRKRRMRKSFIVPAVVTMLAGAVAASAADGDLVALRSLKLSTPPSKFVLQADDSTIPFPSGTEWAPPYREALIVRINGVQAITLASDSMGTPGNWRRTDGVWRYKDDAGSKFSLTSAGKMKLKTRSFSWTIPSSASRVLVEIGSTGYPSSEEWKICARFEASDLRRLKPGEFLLEGISTGSAMLTECPAVVEGCGDGDLDSGEACDDYNLEVGDGCTDTCTTEVCGDGVHNWQEECDDGNTVGGDGCDYDCSLCGNRWRTGHEDCDPPYTAGGQQFCREDCSFSVCGDGVLEAGEGCEPSSGLDTACPGACGTIGASPCTCPASCGNGIRDGSEECDPTAADPIGGCPSTSQGYFGPIQCVHPTEPGPCTCCNHSCGIGGLGCCTQSFCQIVHMGIGSCVEY